MFDDTGGCYMFIVTWVCMFLSTFSELFHKADLDQQDQEKTLRVPAWQWVHWPAQELFELCRKLYAFSSRGHSADFGALAGGVWVFCKMFTKQMIETDWQKEWINFVYHRFWRIFVTISSPNSWVVTSLNDADLLARPAFFICNGVKNAHFGSLLIPCEIELADMKDQT